MTVLAIAPMHNTGGKKDATGAFIPEARQFARLHGGKVLLFDNSKPSKQRFADVIDLLQGRRGISCVAFFCHGLRNGLQVGATLRNAHVLAAALRDVGATSVPLYACDAARDNDADREDDQDDGPGGVGGFASVLASAGPFRVDAHTTAAHTTKNPNVRRFDGSASGEWIVAPRSAWWPMWRETLKIDPIFRLSFPLWTNERIVAELARRVSAA